MRRAQLHPFRPRLLDALQGYNRQRFSGAVGKIEVLPELEAVLGAQNIVPSIAAAVQGDGKAL